MGKALTWLRAFRVVRRASAIGLLSLILILFATPASARHPVAPLPEGIQPSAAKKVQGLYAESQFSLVDVDQRFEAFEAGCKERGIEPKVEGRDLLSKGRTRLYRTPTSVAVFEDSPTLEANTQACSAVITLSRDATVKTGPWESIRPYNWVDAPAGSCPRLHRCWKDNVAGVRAQCVDLGDGLMGTTSCVSVQEDLSKGLILGGTRYSDDGSVPNTFWGYDRVLTHALIDPAVFAGDPAPPSPH